MDIHKSLLQYIEQILGNDLTTDSVSKTDIEKLQKYKLLPLVAILINKKLIHSFDRSYLNPVRFTRLRTWRINIQVREMFRVYAAFQKEGISVIPYKGLCFTRQFYPNVHYRDSVDVDFAISVDDLQQIGVIMESLGYVEAKGKNDYEDVTKTRGFYIDYSWLLYDKNGKAECNIEFHWQAANSALYAPIQFKNIINEVEEVVIKGKAIQSFTKPFQALVIVCHHGLVDGWGKFRHLVDLMLIDKGLSPSEWSKLRSLLVEYKIDRVLTIGMAMSHNIFDYQSKNQILISDEHKFSLKLIKLLKNDRLMLKWSEQPIKFLYYLKMRDNIWDKLISIKIFLIYSLKEFRFKF